MFSKKIVSLFAICISVRVALALIARSLNHFWLRYAGYLALLPAIGFLYIYFSNARSSGLGSFGQKIWWGDLRPIHAFFYLAFAYKAINGLTSAWLYLLADAIFGLASFLVYHLVLEK